MVVRTQGQVMEELMKIIEQFCANNPDQRLVLSIVDGNNVSTYRMGNSHTTEVAALHGLKLFIEDMIAGGMTSIEIAEVIGSHVWEMTHGGGDVQELRLN